MKPDLAAYDRWGLASSWGDVIRRHNERRAAEREVTTPSSGADVPIRRHRSPAQRLAAKPE